MFSGPDEHQTNELPWPKSLADVVVIGQDGDGQIDLAHLAAELTRAQARPLKSNAFSAARNVTGVVTDTNRISALLHGALALWGFAAAAPYESIEMYAEAGGHPKASQDAIFLNPHKLIGGRSNPMHSRRTP